MRSHLGLGSVKADEIPEGTVLAVAEVLKKSTLLKISDDGESIVSCSISWLHELMEKIYVMQT